MNDVLDLIEPATASTGLEAWEAPVLEKSDVATATLSSGGAVFDGTSLS